MIDLLRSAWEVSGAEIRRRREPSLLLGVLRNSPRTDWEWNARSSILVSRVDNALNLYRSREMGRIPGLWTSCPWWVLGERRLCRAEGVEADRILAAQLPDETTADQAIRRLAEKYNGH